MKLNPTDTLPTDGTEVLVFCEVAGDLLVRNASYDDGEQWEMQGFADRASCEGWWFYTNSLSQERIEPPLKIIGWLPMPER